MKTPADSNRIRTAIERALSGAVQGVQLPGIAGAELRSMTLTVQQVQHLAAQLEKQSYCEMRLSVEVELFLRVSNTNEVSSIECTDFLVRIDADGDEFTATVNAEQDWAMAWERGMEPVKQAVLQDMQTDVWNMDATLAENSSAFRAAMVLLVSERVGPYVDRIATFAGYPLSLVELIAARLQEAKIWEGDQVRCESWCDPNTGGIAFRLDVMVAEGKLIRTWSQERGEYAYREPDIRSISRFAVQ